MASSEQELSGGGEGRARAARLADATPTRAQTAASVAILAVLYLWVFPYHAAVNNPNENVRVYMTVAIVDDHTFAINRLERDWGYVNDKSIRDGRLYSSKAPGTSYLGVPAYWLLTRITGRDSHALTAAQLAAHHKPPLDRAVIVYVLRLFANVIPALVFAWFWHRFLGSRTRLPALREAVFFSTMAGSLLYAYSEMFASHAQNAFAIGAAFMALATIRERDAAAEGAGAPPRASLGLWFAAGLFGAAATMFEYPAAVVTGSVALLILATAVARRRAFAAAAAGLGFAGALLAASGRKPLGGACLLVAAGLYAATLDLRALARLAAAGAGGAIPTALTLFYHKRCFGDPFKPGYSYLENPQFRAETSQGFFGATQFAWESGLRLWFDPAFGLVPMTAVFLAAVAGAGAYLSWRPPARLAGPVRGEHALAVARVALAAVAGVAAYKTVGAILVAKNANYAAAQAGGLVWLAYLALAAIALAALTLPRAWRGDAGLGAAMLLGCYALSRLIGMMNNWRGGWQVGPRYLATLAPVVAILALAGLDALAHGSPARRRAVTVFAAGATLHAMLVSGLPSAYFPHIPTEFVSPFFELFLPLLRGGFAPHNVGRHVLHWEGTKGMLPFFVAAFAAAVVVLRGDERRPVAAAAHALGGIAVMLLLLVPLAVAVHPETAGVTRFVMSVWEPRPPSRAAAGGAGAGARGVDGAEALRREGQRLEESGSPGAALDAFRRAAAMQR